MLSVCHCVAFIAYKHNSSTGGASGRGFRSAVSPVVASFRSSFRCAVGLYRTARTAQQFAFAFPVFFAPFRFLLLSSRSAFPCSVLAFFGGFCSLVFYSALLYYTRTVRTTRTRAHAIYIGIRKAPEGFTPSARSSLFLSGSVCNIESGGVVVAVAVRLVAR